MARFLRLPVLLVLLACGLPAVLRAQASAHPGTMINLNDFGTADVAYIVLPQQEPRGGIIVVHDSWGLTDAVKSAADRLAKEGYVAIAPDLMNGQVTPDPLRAADFERALDHASAVKTILASVRCLRESPRFHTERVGLVGWGLGARLALETATAARTKETPALDSVVVIGLPLPVAVPLDQLSAPLLALFRNDDTASSAPQRDAFTAALDATKKPADVRVIQEDAKRSGTWHALLEFLAQTSAGIPQTRKHSGLFDRLNPFHDEPAGSSSSSAPASPLVGDPPGGRRLPGSM